jgi:predicted small lipoprotein YifL
MRNLQLFALLLLSTTLAGCGGSGEAILPTDKLTPEQEAAVKLEDKAIEDEESQGQMKPQKKK